MYKFHHLLMLQNVAAVKLLNVLDYVYNFK